MARLACLAVVAVFLLSGTNQVLSQSQDNIRFQNNRYSGILVAISDTLSYDPQIVDKIKSLFNEASSTLFKATGFRAYFKDVTILVPTNWTVPNAEAAKTESYEKANIRVDNPSSQYGDNPWVSQSGGCGVPGDFMHLTPKFLVDKINSVRKWGPLAKVFVHEWGHLRWGLFDEYPIGAQVSEHFYQSPTTGTLEASRCNIDVKGRLRHRRTGADCKVDALTSLPESDCRYYPNKEQTKSLASLMYYHFLPSVESFCDDDDLGAGTVHNYEAPSLHNRLCSGRSSWSVMKQHPDFNNGANGAVDDNNLNTDVNFKVVQRRESRVVVVMDVSGSMNIDRNYVKLNSAVRRYLLYTVPTGAWVGLVRYSSDATDISGGLQLVNSSAVRNFLADRVPLEKKGGTAIGKGLKRALLMLEAGGADPAGSRIILLTDGQENVKPFVDKVQPEIIQKGITVDTILITANASNVLISLAAQTGGMSFYTSGDSQSTSLSDAFTTSERARMNDPRNIPVTIQSRVVPVEPNDESCYDVMVDKALGRNTMFTFSWVTEFNAQEIKITNATGSQLATITNDNQTNSVLKCEGQCDTGKWTVCITNKGSAKENVVCQVESMSKMTAASDGGEVKEDELPITVRTNIVNREPSFKDKDAKPVTLYASVTRGYAPVVGAKVVANIEYPNAGLHNKTRLEMRDDGAGADIVKGDGTYSAYIINSKAKGKHSINIEVASVGGTSVKTVTTYSKAGAISEPGEPIAEQDVKLTPADDFQRYSLAGFIEVKSIAPIDTDRFPPSRVTDLEVTGASYDDSSVTLEWTAVGDNLDKGTAKSYELWRADSHKIMYRARETNASKVEQSDLRQGSLSAPKEAYSRERIVLEIPDRDTIHVYALIVRDEAGNPSEMSNIVSAKVVYVEPTASSSTNVALIAGVTCGVVALVIVAVIVGVLFAKGVIGSKRKSMDAGPSSSHSNKAYYA